MSDYTQQYEGPIPVASLSSAARAQFLKRTYAHVFAAILAFTGIEVALFTTGIADSMARAMLSTSWLLILGGFILAGTVFSNMAARAVTPGAQYGALGGYVLAEAIIFVPMLWIADQNFPGVIGSAAVVTLLAFSGLTALVLTTQQDFSFLGGILKWCGIVALVLIVSGVLFGFQLGTFFSVAMVAYAGAAILYNTSEILHRYPEDRYISAALSLFAAVALMFWYVLRLFMSRD
jgi:uncharacterized protein